jgi:hypothetical protein
VFTCNVSSFFSRSLRRFKNTIWKWVRCNLFVYFTRNYDKFKSNDSQLVFKMATGCLGSLQSLCHSWIPARLAKGKKHICVFLVCVVHFAGCCMESLSFPSKKKKSEVRTTLDYKPTCFFSFLVVEQPSYIRNRNKPQLIRTLTTEIRTVRIKNFRSRDLSIRPTQKLHVVL